MNWKKELNTVFSEALPIFTRWQEAPEDTRVVVRDGKEIYIWPLNENILPQITTTLNTTPAMRVEFWIPDI